MYASKDSPANKIVSASEFKANCLCLIDEKQADGAPITITKRGKPVAEVKPKSNAPHGSLYGIFRSPEYQWNWDPEAPGNRSGGLGSTAVIVVDTHVLV